MSQFISFLTPTSSLATSYDRTKHAADQLALDIPTTFKDAMTVRERVYVEKQGVPLTNVFDEDDPRSFHWVVYASVGTSSCNRNNGGNSTSTPFNRTTNDSLSPQAVRRRSDPTANRVAVGTIRLVPPPRPPPRRPSAPSDIHNLDNSMHIPATVPHVANDTPMIEPYIKLGRLAILPAYRKLGLATLLVRTALDWAAQNSYQVLSPPRPEDAERAKAKGCEGELEAWRGSCRVRTQSSLEKFWRLFGFVRDESMGEWEEEGVMHVGMWLRLNLRE
ncbi:acyl-CoA N-acyltransferase [Macrophomina phaseolina]|uniref:Acyl-CoA N-acyltransferase n=1 Tax=Macrophomina phaseolina TaxID=35725 RepID=A0ABQ8G1S8_9PEZI|nr:acyl-CoA N-acyltransferase [Macrophomina phaseolina]